MPVVAVAAAIAAVVAVFGLAVRRFRGVRHRLTRPELRNRALEEAESLFLLVEEREAARPEHDPIIKDHEYPHRRVTVHDEDGDIRDVKSRDLNAYIKEVMGDEFTAKDFRTWAGTLLAALKLAEVGPITEPKKAEKNVLAAVDAVAGRLGNTRDIARSSYISPRVIDHYLEGSVVAYYGGQLEEVIAADQGDLAEEERALLELLKKKLRRELQKAA